MGQVLFQLDSLALPSQFRCAPGQIAGINRHATGKRPCHRQRQFGRRFEQQPVTDIGKDNKTVQHMIPVSALTRHVKCQVDLGRRENANRRHSRH